MDDALRQKVLGIALAFASTFFYAGMYLCIQYGGTSPFDFHIFRSLMLTVIFLVPKLCQDSPNIVPKDAKIRVSH